MQAPCESISRKLLPSVRGMIVKYMYEEVGLTQLQIARALGVSQSSISRYVNRQRGAWSASSIPELEDKVREIAQLLLESKVKKEDVLCEICKYIRTAHPEVLEKVSRITR